MAFLLYYRHIQGELMEEDMTIFQTHSSSTNISATYSKHIGTLRYKSEGCRFDSGWGH
jgi:hypothetical protein